MARAKKRPSRSASTSTGKGRAAQRGATLRSDPDAPASSPFAAAAIHDDALEQALLTGDRRGQIEEYLGEDLYRELRSLAGEANRASVRGNGPRVLILPGITGSKLGKPRAFIDDVVWVDPIDVFFGRLKELAIGSGKPRHQPLGVFLFAYLKMKYRLAAAGFDAAFWPYDWRLGIDELGKVLADHLNKVETVNGVHLVCHSMGGLVARAAAPLVRPDRLGRVVMLGTPNHGSFAIAAAIRGTASTVRKLAFLDPTRTGAELADQVINTFPSVYQLLPSREKYDGLDMFDPGSWPTTFPLPRTDLLARAQRTRASLYAGDGRFTMIAGVDQDTIVGASKADSADGFTYDLSPEGDGTVPLFLARLDTAHRTYFVREEHSALCNNRAVAAAVADILNRGETAVLPDTYTPARRAAVRSVHESALRVAAFDVDMPRDLSARDLRGLLDEFVSPRSADDAAPGVALTLPRPLAASLDGDGAGGDGRYRRVGVVIGRRRQHNVDVRVVDGSITDVEARAYVVGVFDAVVPTGAAAAINARLGGAIDALVTRRMLSAGLGHIHVLPVDRRGLPTEVILLAGLGPFDRFDYDAQRAVAENVMRSCLLYRIEDFATVLFGAGSGLAPDKSLVSILSGFWEGLRDSGSSFRFRSVTICESDPGRYRQLCSDLYACAGSPTCDEVAVTIDEVRPDRIAAPEPAAVRLAGKPAPVYLSLGVRTAPGADSTHYEVDSFVLGASTNAVVMGGSQRIAKREWEALRTFPGGRPSDIAAYGASLAQKLLAPPVLALLQGQIAPSGQHPGHPLRLILDATASGLPWEALRIGDLAPALRAGVSRSLRSDALSVAKFLNQRRIGASLDVLLVVNPTMDLPGAERECEIIREVLTGMPETYIHMLRHHQATKGAILERLRTGDYDVLHFAGHASFNSANPSLGGLLCYGEQEITGPDLARLANLPSFVFLNACESGRVRRTRSSTGRPIVPAPENIPDRATANISVAEALLRGGVGASLGTYWPVGDDSAAAFAEVFYHAIAAGRPIGEALIAGRDAVAALSSAVRVDWADYILYGDPEFQVKLDGDRARRNGEATAEDLTALPPAPVMASPRTRKTARVKARPRR